MRSYHETWLAVTSASLSTQPLPVVILSPDNVGAKDLTSAGIHDAAHGTVTKPATLTLVILSPNNVGAKDLTSAVIHDAAHRTATNAATLTRCHPERSEGSAFRLN